MSSMSMVELKIARALPSPGSDISCKRSLKQVPVLKIIRMEKPLQEGPIC